MVAVHEVVHASCDGWDGRSACSGYIASNCLTAACQPSWKFSNGFGGGFLTVEEYRHVSAGGWG